jgi:UDP-N-acetyl-D-mannosaminuronic acid transferase (WecB/TagA/CpsF family)
VWAKRDIDSQPFDTGIPVSGGIAERYTSIDTSIPVCTGMEFAGDDSDNEGSIDAQIVKHFLQTRSKNKTIKRVGLLGGKQGQLRRIDEALRRAGILEGN